MISSTIRKAGPYAGDGVTVTFPFAFKVFKTTDVMAIYTNAAGVESTLTSGVTVALNSNQDVSPGGIVSLTTPLPTGAKLTLTSNVAATQPMQITNGGGFFPRVLNDSADRAMIVLQQIQERLSRTLTTPISSNETTDGLAIPGVAARAGKVLAFDAAGRIIPIDSAGVPDSGLRTQLAAAAGTDLIGFRNPLIAGAVNGTLVGKLVLDVSVTDFGADPTGVADSTAAFNRATSASAVHIGNGTLLKRRIRVPAGLYRIDGKVYVRRGQSLVGDGWASSWIDFTAASGGGFVLGCGDTGTVDAGGLGVIVSGLFFYGNAAPAIDTSKPDSWGVIDSMFTECGVAVRAGGTDGQISRCIFDGGDVMIDWVSGHSHRSIGNLFFNARTDMRVYSNACDILHSNNIHQYTEVTCLQLMAGATGIRNFIFQNNNCFMNGQYESHVGFVFINSTGADIQVKNNAFRNGRGLALAYGGGLGNRVVFAYNEVDGTKTTTVYDQSSTAGGVEVSNMEVSVISNRFLNLPGPVIFCAPSSGTIAELKGNTFRRNTGGTTEIQIVGANGASSITVDPTNTSDREIVPAQSGVPVFAPAIARSRAVLVGGQAVIALPLVRTSSSITPVRYQDGGSVGASYSISRSPGVGFTIQAKDGTGANQALDTSTIEWTLDLRGL